MRISGQTGLKVYLTEIQADLSQVENLLAGAAAMLLTGFTNITSLARAQQGLAVDLVVAAAAAEGKASRRPELDVEDDPGWSGANEARSLQSVLVQQAVITHQIEREVNAIVRSLQFPDLSAQLLHHAKGCLAALESSRGTAWQGAAVSASLSEDGGKGAADRTGHTRRAAAEIIMFPRSKPVIQQGMDTGDIELF